MKKGLVAESVGVGVGSVGVAGAELRVPAATDGEATLVEMMEEAIAPEEVVLGTLVVVATGSVDCPQAARSAASIAPGAARVSNWRRVDMRVSIEVASLC